MKFADVGMFLIFAIVFIGACSFIYFVGSNEANATREWNMMKDKERAICAERNAIPVWNWSGVLIDCKVLPPKVK